MGEATGGSENQLAQIDGVQVYALNDHDGRPTTVSAIHEDAGKIRTLADRLQRCGYGVLRERNPRSGRIYHRLRATWPGPGEPPADPLGQCRPTNTESGRRPR